MIYAYLFHWNKTNWSHLQINENLKLENNYLTQCIRGKEQEIFEYSELISSIETNCFRLVRYDIN